MLVSRCGRIVNVNQFGTLCHFNIRIKLATSMFGLVKLEFHGTDTDTDIRDAPIV